MLVLLALLWCVYVSECFVRQRPGEWLFTADAFDRRRASAEPGIQLLDGRVGLSWTGLLPWSDAFIVHGDQLDLAAATARYESVRRSTRALRFASGALFAWVMVGLTVLVLSSRLLQALLPFACIGAAAWIATFVAFVRAFRQVHGTPPALETWLTLALSPISLMRATQTVCTTGLTGIHPVAAAAVLLGDAGFVKAARAWHFDDQERRPAVERIARARKLLEQLTAAPRQWEAGVARYCPRCHETYTSAAVSCADCADVTLVALPTDR